MADSTEYGGAVSTTQEQDIETALSFYADLLALEARMEVAGEPMSNRGRWIDAIVPLRKARESLQQFIGERMTADLLKAHETAQLARIAEVDKFGDSDSTGGDS
jgi:hypothetical protein